MSEDPPRGTAYSPPPRVVDAWWEAPPDTFETVLAWVRAQAGTRGRRSLAVTVVTDDGVWTETHIPQPAKILKRRRRER